MTERVKQITDKKELLSTHLYEDWDDIEDEFERAQVKEAILDKAKELKCITTVRGLFKSVENMKRGFMINTDQLPEYITVSISGSGAAKHIVNPANLARYIRAECSYRLVRDNLGGATKIIWYSDGVYKWLSETELQGYVKAFIARFNPSIVKMKDVQETVQQLKTDLSASDENELNADENIINFQNGLYHIAENELRPHTPEALSTIQIPCNYSNKTAAAPVFSAFMNDLTSGDDEKKRLLLQYMAVCISNIKGYRLKKALFMYGQGNTGKSQLLRLTQMLLGVRNYSTVDLPELEKRFGTGHLYMKRLSGNADMSYMPLQELSTFKSITGGDALFAERKGQDGFYFTYSGMLWYCMNELPRFGGDRGRWVYERIIPIECSNVIPPERRDKLLIDKMYDEREAIINMLIPELTRVIENGYNFDIPKAAEESISAYMEQNSPVRMFFKECCIMRNTDNIRGDSCTTGVIYDTFKKWYADNYGERSYVPSNQKFKKELMGILDAAYVEKIEKRTNHGRYYIFTLNLETKQQYHIYDTMGSVDYK